MGFLKKLEGHLVAPKADVNLQLSDQFVVLGDTLEGTFTVTPHEDIQADEIRCEIKCMETAQVMKTEYDPVAKRMVTRQVTENRVLYQTKPPCTSATHLANGAGNTFKFSISIPVGARPTYMSAADAIQWEIKGVVAVHGRPDVTTKEIQFQVIPPSERPANEPPKIRLVACQYCQTEMPETTLTCPNCGARRTAQ
jgi:arrestin (S-antigen)-like protein